MADSARNSEGSPLYHDIPTVASTAIKVTGVSTIVMVVLSFIFCLVKGSSNHTFYLLACNLVISSIIAITTQANKYWYVILVGAVIIFQCLTTDVYVFSLPHNVEPTHAPTTTAPMFGITAPSL
ncbi:hypothetical protein LSH36_269g10011 [Paralvinella palmiformis]|uniref:Uncharacterized protein n=1 Tax=Paralvinella palmiformis TaxID=53620 RepID=A0AAD9N2L4_9ANNE|nr:hypothetical protein LSH36_269g10011 [Paralvinella palmiformis]